MKLSVLARDGENTLLKGKVVKTNVNLLTTNRTSFLEAKTFEDLLEFSNIVS